MAIVEILPPHAGRGGLVYSAAVYTTNGEHVLLTAEVSEGLRRRMAATAKRALTWARQHVRVPAGALQDLMAGNAPDCGCDAVGEAFRAACLEAAEIADVADGIAGAELSWSFDDWDGMEDQFLGDIGAAAFDTFDTFGATRALATLGPRRSPLATPGSKAPAGRAAPGIAALTAALRAILGH